MSIKRYDWVDNGRFEFCENEEWAECKDGDYVKHQDHLKAMEAKEAELNKSEHLRKVAEEAIKSGHEEMIEILNQLSEKDREIERLKEEVKRIAENLNISVRDNDWNEVVTAVFDLKELVK